MPLHNQNQLISNRERLRRPGYETVTVVPNPQLKLLDQIREVMRLKQYSIRTERSYWVRRYVQFHHMPGPEAMFPAEPKMEAFLSHLAIDGTANLNTEQSTSDSQR